MSLDTRSPRIFAIVASLLLATIFSINSSLAKSTHTKSINHKGPSHHTGQSNHRHSSHSKIHTRSQSSHPNISSNANSGKATIYSDKFNGKKTANGERFRQDKLTAASPTLPLGTKVRVTNKDTGKSVTVKINDRQARGGNRVVDLSKAAANKVGIKGTGNVQTTVLGK